MRTCCCCILVCGLLAALAWAAESMTVQVKSGQIRQAPSFLGAIVAEVPFGQDVQAEPAQNGWHKVAAGPAQGFMHQTALARRELALAAGQTTVKQEASTRELALAGKGFSKNVEEMFRQKRADLDYSWIDRMEARRGDPLALRQFVTEGGLLLPGRDG